MNGGNYYEYINSNWCRYCSFRRSRCCIGIGIATGKASEAVARQPEAEGKISKTLILGCALAEATAIYGFVIALMIIIMLQ